MEDKKIIELYFDRNEEAIKLTDKKYGKHCYCIAYRILGNTLDAAECKNDTLLAVWNSIPPARPASFSAFIATLARRNAIDKSRHKNATSRGGKEYLTAFEELAECIPDSNDLDDTIDAKELGSIISAFLRRLPKDEQTVFVRRYWYFESIKDIAARYGFSSGKVKMMLSRTRNRLLLQLEKENVL